MHKITLAALILLTSSLSYAVSLEEALTSGYKNHEELKIIRTEFLNDVEKFPRALADFMPNVTAGFQAVDNKVTKRSSAFTTDNISTNNENFTRSITLEQSIFNGGSSVAGLKAAQSYFRSAKGNFYTQEQNIFFDEITTYLNWVEASEKYNISKISLKSNQTQLEAMKEKFRLGESTETEVASAESGLANAEANKALAYANFEAAKANFTKVFAIEDATNAKMPEIASNMPNTLEEFIDKAIASHPAIHAAQHAKIAHKAEEYAAKGGLLPKVSVKVQSANNTYSPQSPGNGNQNNDSLSSALSVNVPILSNGGVEYSNIRRAKYQTKKAVLQLDSQIKLIKSNCKAAWEAFNASKTRIEATSTGVKAAEIAYEGMKQEEMLGSKTIVDVLTFEDRLNKARESRIDSEKELVLASYKIKSLMGELTAQKMKLPVEYFNPDKEFRKIKLKIIGF